MALCPGATKIKETLYDIEKDTPKTLVFNRGTHFRKSNLMVPDSIFRNTISGGTTMLQYYLYCYPEQQEQAEIVLKATIMSRFEDLENSLLTLKTGLCQTIRDKK